MVDVFGVEVGTAELASGLVARKFDDDLVLLPITPQGITEGPITFYHSSRDCSGDRYLWNNGGLFAYFGQVVGGTVFFTRLADGSNPVMSEELNSIEVVATNPGVVGGCLEQAMGKQSVGKAIEVVDPAISALRAPFRLK